MSILFEDTSSNTNRYARDRTASGTTTNGDNFYKAKSLWTESDPVGAPGVFDTPPQDGSTTEWVFGPRP